MGLSPVRGFLDRVIYSDEVQFNLPRGVGEPHGKLDLLIGSKTKVAENCFVTVAFADNKLQMQYLERVKKRAQHWQEVERRREKYKQ